MKSTKEFILAMKENAGMLDDLGVYLRNSKCETEEMAMQALVQFAQDQGYELNLKELKDRSNTEGRELSEEELSEISGGGIFDDIFTYLHRFVTKVVPVIHT